MVQYALVARVTCYSLVFIVQVYIHCFDLYAIYFNTIADINECRSNKGICGTDKICYNIRGGYLCLCKVGYRQSENGSCEGMIYPKKILCALPNYIILSSDVNECSNRNLCGLKQHCVNTPGSYRCECDTGYQKIKKECVGMLSNSCNMGKNVLPDIKCDEGITLRMTRI